MADILRAACAVLLQNPGAEKLKFIATIAVSAPRTSSLGDAILPTIYKIPSVLAALPSHDSEDYACECYWLPERKVVEILKTVSQQREYIEDNFCNDLSYVGNAVRLTVHNEYKIIEEKPDNLIVILSKYHATALPTDLPLPSAFSQRRAPSPISKVHDQTKHRETIAKAARSRKSPSTEAQLSQLRATQARTVVDAIYNGRPFELLGDDHLEFPPEELKNIREYVRVSVAHHMNEATRVQRMADLTNNIVGHSILNVTDSYLSSGGFRPDGVVEARAKGSFEMFRILRCIVKVKNEIGEGGSEELQEVRAICCCPCLLIGIAGPRIIVSGAVFADTLLIQELSDYRSSVPRPTLSKRSMFDQQIYETGRLFRAIKTAIDDLGAFYESLKLPPPRHRSRPAASLAPPNVYIGPQFTQFEKDGRTVTLTYTGRLSDEYPFQAVFTAIARLEGSDTTHDVVVKFTHDYCEEGHRLLADHQTPEGAPRPLAPTLWHCCNNQDVGMYVVVMDWIMDTEEREMTEEDHATVREAIALLHERNLVFGDLREPNVLLIKGGGVMLIDFDRCGQEGTARYPRDMIEDGSIPWAEDAQARQLIKKQHDLHMLTELLSED
ncbi:hypothetical protein PYCCODRAFT_1509747 [Trametes coccinea BRFM310]|uniref:Protein kinase domain-containing protein n=1 Tax=Trametes coccinea (strain BRFM310) TaxID=1353009 RepID=A0A1Y2IHE9_TRAC3|nr:hypothetical protein PYCCODRAFT_1509747 [Trametes coccinea BRFM310]